MPGRAGYRRGVFLGRKGGRQPDAEGRIVSRFSTPVTIIVAGTIGRSGLGGQTWAVLQYLLGFRALGHDVYYLEDCGVSSWVYDWDKSEWTTELDYPAAYVRACLEPFGFAGKWIYRTNDGALGVPLKEFIAI